MAALEENAELYERINRELAVFGQLTSKTANDLKDAQTGIKNFSMKMGVATSAVGSLADAFVSYNKEIYAGSSANKAAAASMDKMADAAKYAGAFLALLVPGGPIVKAFVAGIGLLAAKSLQVSKLIAEQADEVYNGFQGLAQAGAAGKGGMEDVFQGLQKVGLGTQKFGEYLRLVNENSQDLALFGGTVMQGRKIFEDTMGSLTSEQKKQMELMGLGDVQRAEVTMQYLKQQRLLTMGTKAQMDTSSTAVMRYIKETDELTRITGLNRKEQEKVIERAMAQQQFAAKIDQLESEGNTQQAKQLRVLGMVMKQVGGDMEQAVLEMSGGFAVTGEASSKANLSTNFAMFEMVQRITNTKMTMEEMGQAIGKVTGQAKENWQALGQMQAMMGNLTSYGADVVSTRRFIQVGNNDLVKAFETVGQETKNYGDMTEQAAKNEIAARETQLTAQRLVNEGLAAFITANGKVVGANEQLFEKFEKFANLLSKTVMPALEAFATFLGKFTGGVLDVMTGSEQKIADNLAAKQAVRDREEATKGMSLLQRLGIGRTAEQQASYAKYSQSTAGIAARYELEEYGPGGDTTTGAGLEKRAAGGPVGRGSPYLVGEEGPELFVPSIAGDIVPLNKLTGTTGAALRQSDRIEKAVKEITLDTIEIEKITDTDAKRAKDYSKFYQTYIELKTTYEKKQMELINYQMNESSGGGGGGGGAGGSGLQLPAARSIAGMGGGQGLTKMGQGDLAQMGLMIRSKDTQAEGAGISPSLIELAKQIQSGVPGFAGFTAFNDKFHNEKAPSSQHTKGLALDFALGEKPSIETGRAITQWLRDSGASLAIDEYNNPSAGATGGHIHAQIPAFAEGGQLGAGRVGIAGEAGPELITGPASITPMNDLTRALDSMSGLLQQSVMKLDEISRATQRNGDINDKMLSYAQN